MSADSKKTAAWFVAANLIAGAFNYLYQVAASRELTAQDFSQLNSWFAALALFFTIGGLLQYAANFFITQPRVLRKAILGINMLALVAVVEWRVAPEGQTLIKAAMIVVLASCLSWLIGQAQSRLLFMAMTMASLIVSVAKVGLVFVSTVGNNSLERCAFALFACYLPGLWWLSASLWNQPAQSPSKKQASVATLWQAAFILSTAAAIIPQIDLVVMSAIQSPQDYAEFARASLFFKAIYFLMFIFAQWLLPQQIRSERGKPRNWLALAATALVASAALTAVAPVMAQYLLGWDHSPDLKLIFLANLNMSLLTWIFFDIQSACSAHEVRIPGVILGLILIEAAAQKALALAPTNYLAVAIVAQAIFILILTLSSRQVIPVEWTGRSKGY